MKPFKTVVLSSVICVAVLINSLSVFADEIAESIPDQSSEAESIERMTTETYDYTEELSEPSVPETEPVPDTVLQEAEPPVDLWDVEFSPNRNTTSAKMRLLDREDLVLNNGADRVQIDAVMTYGGQVTRSVSKTLEISDFDSEGCADLDLGDYGKWSVTVTFLKDGSAAHKNETEIVGIVADVYNIAPVTATLPVTFFSLNLWGDNNIRQNGPTILMMERPGAYDWNALPSGVYAIPYLTRDQAAYQPPTYDGAAQNFRREEQAMVQYVRDLYELDQNSVFNLYCVDVYIQLIQEILYANQIPETRYTITMMSDGSFTYSQFTSLYAGTEPEAVNETLKAEWQASKDYAYENGEFDPAFTHGVCKRYIWAAIDLEPNARYWVARKDLLVTNDDENAFGKSVQANSKIEQVNIGSLLKTNIQSSEQNTAEFKALYNFNDSYFEEAKKQGKDAMVFLGTRVTYETGFEDYAKFVMSYYGDTYVYYYKGHPGTPTDLYPNKADQLKRLGITDVDSSVAAELILFFNPEIYLSGYQSSTYASVPVGMGKGMFNMSKAAGLSDPQYANMAFWMTPVTDGSDERVKDLCVNEGPNYLVEFSDTESAEKGYDIAVWDTVTPEIRFYKEENGEYILVDSSGGIKDRAVEPGVYVIGSAAKPSMVLDVAKGSKDPKGNIQIYHYNGTEAQKWEVRYDEDGLATIVNSGSGLVLDAAGGKTDKRTNIQQYRDNGTPAQKWILTKNADGTIRIASSLSEKAVFDIAGGLTADRTNVQLYPANGTNAQAWLFYPADPEVSAEGEDDLEEGYYVLSGATRTDLCLQVQGGSCAEKANIQVGSVSNKENQLFRITKKEDGFYRIQNAFSGLNVTLDKGSLIPGANVYQSSEDGPNASWAIFRKTGGSYVIINAASGTVLEMAGTSWGSGTNADGGQPNDLPSQRWMIRKAEAPQDVLDAMARENADALQNGVYVICAGKTDNVVFDVKKGSKEDRANVQVYRDNSTLAQVWAVSHDEKGYVTIKNLLSGKVLDIAGGKKAVGSNVQQYRSNGTPAQKWIIIKTEDGSYKIVSGLSDYLVMDIQGGKLVSGSNVQVYRDNDTAAQRYHFRRLD